jgi:kynureninase
MSGPQTAISRSALSLAVDWTVWRDEFPTFRTKTYLNTCSLAPLSRRVREAQERFLDEWEALGASAWYELWMHALDALRGKVARVLGARKEEIALAPSVSVALSAVASALDHSTRPRVVLSDLDFPTLAYQWAVKPQVERRFVPSEDGIHVSAERIAAAVDERTALVATSHVYYTSGAVQDIAQVAEAAHAHGALALVDAYQGTGQLPTDVHAADVDVLVTGGLKWLLGGTGIAFLYVKEALIPRLRPTIAGWFGNAEQFAFDAHAFTFHEDARRFELGTTANAAVYAASAGLDIVLELGVDRIRHRTSELTTDIIERLSDAGYALKSPSVPEERAGIVAVQLRDPAKAVKSLAVQDFIVDYRHDRLRISPYFYNTPEDNERFVDTLRTVSPPR